MDENIMKGGISVETEHIFPIIKRWLYSEKDIFLREIVSNASDAITKLKRLASLGEVRDLDDDFKITVSLNKSEGTLTVTDNGIGMSEDEIRRYICQIALSGALEFIQKYENTESAENNKNGIIGHFGLGFYSSFMVSDTVEVITKSYTGAPAVRWVCNEAGEYEIYTDVEKEERGTSVVMHISESENEFLDEHKLRAVLDKYCAFMPVEIFFINEEAEECECEDENCEHKKLSPINDTNPLWQRAASECTDEDYAEFYRKVFYDYKEPLFHIHLNADYPLNFKGVLYFPKISSEFESLEGQVKLYYNQVFVADNMKEVIPEYMLMLKGVLDCPELPLNVSRSYLQNNTYVSKVSAHIVKKVADKLNSLYNTEREKYEGLWRDLKTFVEYASLRDRKFYDRVKGSVLFEGTDGKFVTLDEYLEGAKEKHENTVYYAADKVAQAQYISMFSDEGISVVLLDRVIDTQFINVIEQDRAGVKFVRVDADVAGALKEEGDVSENEDIKKLFVEISESEKLNVRFEKLKSVKVPAILNISEESRRMDDMMRMYAMSGAGEKMSFPVEMTLVVNSSAPLIERLASLIETDSDKAKKVAKQIYTLALLAQRQLTADELQSFLSESFDMLEKF